MVDNSDKRQGLLYSAYIQPNNRYNMMIVKYAIPAFSTLMLLLGNRKSIWSVKLLLQTLWNIIMTAK